MEYGFRDIFESGAQCIVNAVNCQAHLLRPGHQAGLAGAFEERFPQIQDPFKAACKEGRLRPGGIQLFALDRATGEMSRDGDFFIANVATKDHWKPKSQLSWVRMGIKRLAIAVEQKGIQSIAIPQLGAGLGGLDWKDVQREIHEGFEPLSRKGVQVMVLGDDDAGLKGKEVKSFSYAGIGWRDTPAPALKKMADIGEILYCRGGVLRSGGAGGADSAFEEGADRVPGRNKKALRKEIYLPKERGFNGRVADGVTSFFDLTEKHYDLARKYHGKYDALSSFAKNLMARNAQQCLGYHADDPSGVILCYTDKGKTVGGTGQSIRMAKDLGIPIINLGDPKWKDRSAEQIAEFATKVARGESTVEQEIGSAGTAKKSSYITLDQLG